MEFSDCFLKLILWLWLWGALRKFLLWWSMVVRLSGQTYIEFWGGVLPSCWVLIEAQSVIAYLNLLAFSYWISSSFVPKLRLVEEEVLSEMLSCCWAIYCQYRKSILGISSFIRKVLSLWILLYWLFLREHGGGHFCLFSVKKKKSKTPCISLNMLRKISHLTSVGIYRHKTQYVVIRLFDPYCVGHITLGEMTGLLSHQ